MKHILNDLSEQEKNSSRDQHTGGMKVMTERFSKLINSKLGDVKPLVSEQTFPSSGTTSGTTSGETTTNPFKDQSLLNKYVGKQFNTYSIEDKENITGFGKNTELGNNFGTFKIKNAYFGPNHDVVFDLEGGVTATFECKFDYLGLTYKEEQHWTKAAAPSLIKELKQTFCTKGMNKGMNNQSVPKVDYPTP